MKSTKIVCTIGPASEKVPILTKMIEAGMNVARLNFSHGTYENHLLLMENVRKVSIKLKVPIAILQDLQGPKIRIGKLAKPFLVTQSKTVIVGKDFHIDYPVHLLVKPGQRILVQDGLIELRVLKVKGKFIYCEALNSGEIKTHKGVNLPDSVMKFPVITEKDLKDLKFGLKNNVDFVALSFVRGKQDILNARKLIAQHNPKKFALPKIIAKIERPEAVKKIDEIIAVADVIMIARGDMGVELPDMQVPIIQKDIIQKCLQNSTPVIVATQMLESMVGNPRPTRAEVSDVANAVIDHTDAVMLSEESAFGKYPVEAVTEMGKIITAIEKSKYVSPVFSHKPARGEEWIAGLVKSAGALVGGSKARVVVSFTHTGRTARFLSSLHLQVPLCIFTDNEKVYRQLVIQAGVMPFFFFFQQTLEGLYENAFLILKKDKVVKKGDPVVVVSGRVLGEKVNLVEINKVP